jgi:2,3-dihydroxybenzoate-AMP ligase/mycobactin salicyl-AMP ligase
LKEVIILLEGFTEYKKKDAEKYDKLRWWLGITWGDLFDKASDLYPEKEALVDDMSRWTYAELREKVDKLAIGLNKLGIRKGDRVLLQIPNWHEFIISFFALQKMGAIVVLLLPRHTQTEINHFCKLAEPKAWLVPDVFGKIDYLPIIDDVQNKNPQLKGCTILARRPESERFISLEALINDADLSEDNLRELADMRPDPMDVAQIMPTGGTTGLPKAGPRTHNSYMSNVEYHSRAWEITSQDILLVVTPVGHGMALHWGIGGALFNYAKLVLTDSTKAAAICEAIQREKVTAMPTVPALLTALVNFEELEKYDLSSLKKVSVGGAPSTPELVKGVYEKLGCKFISGFGSVEGTCAATRLEDGLETICYSVGRPICPYDTIKVIDGDGKDLPPNREGELVSKGPGIFTGYFKSAEENKAIFTEDGFFRTGDLAEIDELGNIRITGRIKDIIIRGGENISAIDIENLVSEHPGVEEVAVVGMPDEVLGERICAYIQPTRGSELSFEEVISFLKSKGASVLQLPERIEFVDRIPLTKVGKIDKKALREGIKKRLQNERA